MRAAPATSGCKISPVLPSRPAADQGLPRVSRPNFGVRVQGRQTQRRRARRGNAEFGTTKAFIKITPNSAVGHEIEPTSREPAAVGRVTPCAPGLPPARAKFSRRRLPAPLPIKTWLEFPAPTPEFGSNQQGARADAGTGSFVPDGTFYARGGKPGDKSPGCYLLPSGLAAGTLAYHAHARFYTDMISLSRPAILMPSSGCGITEVGNPSGLGSLVVAGMPNCA